MTTIPALPFSGQQLRDTLTALDGAIDAKEASGAAASAVAAHVAAANSHAQYTTTAEAAAAAPVQAVALSVPAGWGGTSANVSGNVTLTLALPVGSTLVGSSDRTNWDAAYSERNRWDGGATGLNAATGRTSLGLGNVDNTSDANKPVSTAVSTALAGKANTGAIGSSGLTMATARLLGRSSAGNGGPEEITLGANLTLSGGTLSASVTGGGGGTVSSVGLVAPTGFSVSGSPVTTSGNITLSFAAGYSLPTTASQGNWDTAFTERGSWDGGSTGLNAATGRISLGLGTLATANASAPPALGGTTPAAGAFTNLSASVELTLPSGAPSAPAARDLYAVADTLRYRDSGNAERLVLNAQDNLANLSNTATARTNLGLGDLATATVGSGLSLSGGALSVTGGGVGGSANYQEFTSSGTWTKPAGVTSLYIEVVSGGAGGGSGRRGAISTARPGGAGGAGGRFSARCIPASLAGATETVTVGAGGTGGAAAAADDTNGNAGGGGGSSSFGSLVIAAASNGGGGGNTTTVLGGTAAPWGPAGLAGLYAVAGPNAIAAGGNGVGGNRCMFGPGSGASGAGLTTSNAAAAAGPGGQGFAEQKNSGATGGAAGGGGAAGTAGAQNGGDGPTYGDGGGSGRAQAATANGSGGNGAFPGGGGGGGAGSENGFNSGAGGNGGAGVVRIWAW